MTSFPRDVQCVGAGIHTQDQQGEELIIHTRHVDHLSLCPCVLMCRYIVLMNKGYHHCLYRASAHPPDPCVELLGQSETQPLHHRCPPPGRTAPRATPLHTRRYATLETHMESSLLQTQRTICLCVTDHMMKPSR